MVYNIFKSPYPPDWAFLMNYQVPRSLFVMSTVKEPSQNSV